MTARQLMRFYPRAWRARYSDEFVEVVGEKNLSMQQAIDIVAGAVDAWTSPAVRASVRGSAAGGSGGAAMIQELKMKCATTAPRMSAKDGLIAAGIMLASTALMVAVATAAKRQGYGEFSEVLLGLSFPASMLFSMPFMYMKGQSSKVKVFFVAVPLAILVAIGYLSVLILSGLPQQ